MAFTKREIDAAHASRSARIAEHESAFRYCPQCDAMIDDEATSCYACGATLPAETSRRQEPTNTGFTESDRARIYEEEKARIEARGQIEAKKKAQGCLGLIVLVFGFWLYSKLSETPPKAPPTPEQFAQQKIDQTKRDAEWKAQHEKEECEGWNGASVEAESFIEKQLLAPSTAKFPWADPNRDQYLGECRHRVQTYVDAQNAFGAQIRTHYSVTLRYVGQNQWKLEELHQVR